jgi:site-specific recombinase XerD
MVKATRGDLVSFAAWWEARCNRPFDPALLRENDLHSWRLTRQIDDAVAPTTINRALVTIRTYCAWAKRLGLIPENPAEEIRAMPKQEPQLPRQRRLNRHRERRSPA